MLTLELKPNQGFTRGVSPQTSLASCTPELRPTQGSFAQGSSPPTSLASCTPELRPTQGFFAQGYCPRTSRGWRPPVCSLL